MVGARRKGEGGRRREKRGEILFSSKYVCWGGGGDRKKTEIKTHTTFFLPFCSPSLSWTQMPKRDAKGPAFLSFFFVLLPPALAPQPGPPPCWAQASERKGQGQEARLWERKREATILGSRNL